MKYPVMAAALRVAARQKVSRERAARRAERALERAWGRVRRGLESSFVGVAEVFRRAVSRGLAQMIVHAQVAAAALGGVSRWLTFFVWRPLNPEAFAARRFDDLRLNGPELL